MRREGCCGDGRYTLWFGVVRSRRVIGRVCVGRGLNGWRIGGGNGRVVDGMRLTCLGRWGLFVGFDRERLTLGERLVGRDVDQIVLDRSLVGLGGCKGLLLFLFILLLLGISACIPLSPIVSIFMGILFLYVLLLVPIGPLSLLNAPFVKNPFLFCIVTLFQGCALFRLNLGFIVVRESNGLVIHLSLF